MENKHTSGPWEIEPHSTIDKTFMVGPGIWVDYDDVDHEEQEANARLIAASPTMLEALLACEVTLKAFLPDAFATIAIVQEAIVKARK